MNTKDHQLLCRVCHPSNGTCRFFELTRYSRRMRIVGMLVLEDMVADMTVQNFQFRASDIL